MPAIEAYHQKMLTEGEIFLKYGRMGAPKRRAVWCSHSLDKVFWGEPKHLGNDKKASGHINRDDITHVVVGASSPIFKKQRKIGNESQCFSLIATDRSLDLEIVNNDDRALWVKAFSALIADEDDAKNVDNETPPRSGLSDQAALPEHGVISQDPTGLVIHDEMQVEDHHEEDPLADPEQDLAPHEEVAPIEEEEPAIPEDQPGSDQEPGSDWERPDEPNKRPEEDVLVQEELDDEQRAKVLQRAAELEAQRIAEDETRKQREEEEAAECQRQEQLEAERRRLEQIQAEERQREAEAKQKEAEERAKILQAALAQAAIDKQKREARLKEKQDKKTADGVLDTSAVLASVLRDPDEERRRREEERQRKDQERKQRRQAEKAAVKLQAEKAKQLALQERMTHGRSPLTLPSRTETPPPSNGKASASLAVPAAPPSPSPSPSVTPPRTPSPVDGALDPQEQALSNTQGKDVPATAQDAIPPTSGAQQEAMTVAAQSSSSAAPQKTGEMQTPTPLPPAEEKGNAVTSDWKPHAGTGAVVTTENAKTTGSDPPAPDRTKEKEKERQPLLAANGTDSQQTRDQSQSESRGGCRSCSNDSECVIL